MEPNPSPYGSQEKEGKEKEKLQTKYTLPPGGGGTHLLVPVLGRQRKVDLCEFKTSLVYRVSSRTARATQTNPVWGKKNLC